MLYDAFCPACGEKMEHWHMDILECPECGTMIDLDELEYEFEYEEDYEL